MYFLNVSSSPYEIPPYLSVLGIAVCYPSAEMRRRCTETTVEAAIGGAALDSQHSIAGSGVLFVFFFFQSHGIFIWKSCLLSLGLEWILKINAASPFLGATLLGKQHSQDHADIFGNWICRRLNSVTRPSRLARGIPEPIKYATCEPPREQRRIWVRRTHIQPQKTRQEGILFRTNGKYSLGTVSARYLFSWHHRAKHSIQFSVSLEHLGVPRWRILAFWLEKKRVTSLSGGRITL